MHPHATSVQERVLAASPELGYEKPSGLFLAIKALLWQAQRDEVLSTPEEDIINNWVKLDPKDKPNDRERPAAGPHVIVGGVKDFHRDPASARLVRADDAWIHFTITVTWDGDETLSLFAYDFEIVFPEGHAPRFVRVDLNEPGHPNEARELRSHVHPGNDDLLLPSPVLTPVEILHYFLYELCPRDAEKPRR